MLAPQKPSPLVLVVAQEHQDRQLAAEVALQVSAQNSTAAVLAVVLQEGRRSHRVVVVAVPTTMYKQVQEPI
jgi:hypothetical protein